MEDIMEEFYHYVVSCVIGGGQQWAYFTNNRHEIDFHASRTVNSILTRQMALKALDMASARSYAEVNIQRVEVTTELCGDQIRQLRREQVIVDKRLTVEEVELIRIVA